MEIDMSNTTELLRTILNMTDNEPSETVKKNFNNAIIDIPEEAFTDDTEHCFMERYLFRTAKEHYKQYGQILTRSTFARNVDNDIKVLSDDKPKYLKAWDRLVIAQSKEEDYQFNKDNVINDYQKERRVRDASRYYSLLGEGKIEAANRLLEEMQEVAKPKSSKMISFVTTKQLETMDIPPVKWIVEDLIPEGLTLMSAPEKSGKSAFVMQMGTSISEGLNFLGKQTIKGKVLYFDLEQGCRINKERLIKQGLGYSDNFFILDQSYWDDVLRLNEEGMKQLRSAIEDNKGTVAVIIDTWGIMRPPTDKETKSMDAYQRTLYEARPIKKLANELHMSITIITHLRKSNKPSDDFTNEVTGGLGTGATADRSLQLIRVRNTLDAKLKGTGRVGNDFEWCLKGDKNTMLWSYEGNASEIKRSEPIKNIISVFKKTNQELGPTEVAAILQMDYEWSSDKAKQIRTYLSRLADDGVLHRRDRGRYSLNTLHELSGILLSEPVTNKEGIELEVF